MWFSEFNWFRIKQLTWLIKEVWEWEWSLGEKNFN
jgi:hypothetical protein